MDGSPYKSEHGFTCKSQVAPFQYLLQEMAACPQDYVSDRGRLTINTVEGFHGLALVYRDKQDKRADLDHTHYTCKTNMDICHKVKRSNLASKSNNSSSPHTEPRPYLEGVLPHRNGDRHCCSSCCLHFDGAGSLGGRTS